VVKYFWGSIRLIVGTIFLMGFIFPLTLRFSSLYTVLCGVIGVGTVLFPLLTGFIQKKLKRASLWIFRGLLAIFVSFTLLFSVEGVLMILAVSENTAPPPMWIFRGLFAIFVSFTLLFSVEGVLMILAVSENTAPPPNATVVVLGASVLGETPSLELAGRIKTAAKVLKENPDMRCVATGGLGDTASITEAACIKKELVQRYSIEPERIFLEEASTNTFENLKNAKDILEDKGFSNEIIIVTGEYHMFRAKFLSERVGLHSYATASSTDYRIFLHSYLRELLAIPKSVLTDK